MSGRTPRRTSASSAGGAARWPRSSCDGCRRNPARAGSISAAAAARWHRRSSATQIPKLVVGCDESAGYVRHASEQTIRPTGPWFAVASVGDLPAVDGGFDACGSGLVLNFLPEPRRRRGGPGGACTRPGGTVAAYVWDYAGGMQLLRVFWDAAVDLDPAARPLDEGAAPAFQCAGRRRCAACSRTQACATLEWRPIEVPTTFTSFDDLLAAVPGRAGAGARLRGRPFGGAPRATAAGDTGSCAGGRWRPDPHDRQGLGHPRRGLAPGRRLA